jgi:tetratricopeptide (TPR) repeat protein
VLADKRELRPAQKIKVLLLRADACVALRKGPTAQRDYEAVLRIAPENPHARWGRACGLITSGKSDDAVRELEDILKKNPDYVRACLTLANLRLSTGDTESCLRLSSRAIDLSPPALDLSWAYSTRANAYSRKQDWENVLKDMMRSIELNPSGGFTPASRYLLRGDAYYYLQRYPEALASYVMARELEPDSVHPRGRIWKVHYAAKRFSLASRLAKEVISADKASHLGWLYQAASCNMLGQFQDGWEAAQQALKRTPSNPHVFAQLGISAVGMKQFDKAVSLFEKALGEDAQCATAVTGLAYLHATCPREQVRDGNEAVRLANQALQLGRGSLPAYLMTMALARAELNDFPLAITFADRGVRLLRPDSSERRLFEDLLESLKNNKRPPFRVDVFQVLVH